MWISFLCMVMLVFNLTGCAAKRGAITNEQYQERINQLEREAEEKDDEIRSLKQEVDSTKEQLRLAEDVNAEPLRKSGRYTTETTTEKACGKLTHRQIQTALKKAGFYDGAIDGKIGKGTRRAIRAFQKENGLVADGVVGKKTRMKLQEYL